MKVEYIRNGKFMTSTHSTEQIEDFFSGSFIIHSGKTEEEAEAVHVFIENALSGGVDIICRDEGFYMSQYAYGSMPHNTYEIPLKNEAAVKEVYTLIKKYLEYV